MSVGTERRITMIAMRMRMMMMMMIAKQPDGLFGDGNSGRVNAVGDQVI